ncbi:peptidylprolyl isomerase [candidate division TA06 bacterium]|uniref:Peptidylprolyl isomerase n=1 Tax=candidate division TA06 bacterium TaxID=2250710 RepID=A0A933MJX1_UNCT6|nr:peptidylprolyl isomerase [candidate division TA06 bacterium]
MKKIYLAGGLLLLALTSSLYAQPAGDGVVTVVDEQPILQSELDKQVTLLKLQLNQNSVPEDSLKKLAMERLIEVRLLMLQAKKESLDVTGAEVEEALNKSIGEMKSQFPSEEAFNAQLKAEATNVEKLKAKHRPDAKNQLLMQKLIDKNIRARVTPPTEKEVTDFYASHKDSIPPEPEKAEVAWIVIVPKPGAAAKTAAIARYNEVMAKLNAKKNFAALAKKYSQDQGSAVNGGDLGWFGRNQMVPEFEKAAFGAKIGQITETDTRYGRHIIKVLEKKGDQVHAAHILISPIPTEADLVKARKLAAGLYRRVTAEKEDFGRVAKTYSDDPMSKENNGLLGLVPVEAFPDAIKAELASMQEGDISEAVESENGLTILKLIKRVTAREPTYENVKKDLTEYLKNKKMQEALEVYLKDLKTKYVIERK